VVYILHVLKPRHRRLRGKTHPIAKEMAFARVILDKQMPEKAQILEVPAPDLIDREFIHEVFSHDEFAEIRAVVPVANHQLIFQLEAIGFELGRQFSKGKNRFQRLRLDRFEYIAFLARLKMQEHGLQEPWEFIFDSAKQRAGLCNYTDHQISLSKYLVEYHNLDQSEQVILHEVAHALAGKDAGHGPNWKQIAKSIGYRGEKFTGKEIAEQTAKWIGECKNGHRHYRYKSPRAQLACGYCGKGFSRRFLITWTERAA
jgi:predicted SprT family Zn-dependent metalloprotease